MSTIPEKPLSELSITSPFAFFSCSDSYNGAMETDQGVLVTTSTLVDSGNQALTPIDLEGQIQTAVDADSAASQTTLNVTSTTNFGVGDHIMIGYNSLKPEVGQIATVNAGVSFVLEKPLKYEHTSTVAPTVQNLECLSDVPGYMTSNGSTIYAGRAMDATDADVFALGEGVLLIWAKVINDQAASTGIIFHVGNDSNTTSEIQVRVDSSGNLAFRIRDDDDPSTIVGSTLDGAGVPNGGATPTSIAIVIDNTVGGKTITGYVNGAQGSAGQTALTTGAITPTSGGISIGIGMASGTFNQLAFTGSTKRLGSIRFDSMPTNMTSIIEELHNYDSMPYWLLDGE